MSLPRVLSLECFPLITQQTNVPHMDEKRESEDRVRKLRSCINPAQETLRLSIIKRANLVVCHFHYVYCNHKNITFFQQKRLKILILIILITLYHYFYDQEHATHTAMPLTRYRPFLIQNPSFLKMQHHTCFKERLETTKKWLWGFCFDLEILFFLVPFHVMVISFDGINRVISV